MSETKTGTIYKISTPKSEKVYVGSTTQAINRRLSSHKCNKTCMAQKLLELGECKIEALEVLYNCTKEELRIKEQHYLELLKEITINKLPAYTTKDQRKDLHNHHARIWVEKNKEKRKIQANKYYHNKAQDPEYRKQKAEEAKLRRDKQREARLAKNKNPESSQ